MKAGNEDRLGVAAVRFSMRRGKGEFLIGIPLRVTVMTYRPSFSGKKDALKRRSLSQLNISRCFDRVRTCKFHRCWRSAEHSHG